jgi:uncharacterized protein
MKKKELRKYGTIILFLHFVFLGRKYEYGIDCISEWVRICCKSYFLVFYKTMNQHLKTIAQELHIQVEQAAATAALLGDGATVPFISRYRKEATGLLDETQVAAVRDRLGQLAELDKRREAIVASLGERELLSPELNAALQAASSMTILEDIYLPYRPKRRTRSSMAKEKGLEPLARAIYAQENRSVQAASFINPEKEVHTAGDAMAGARDIIAEWISEAAATRAGLRKLFAREAIVTSVVVKKNEAAGAKFRDYFDWQEPAAKAPGHRLLAMFRGENEKVLTLALRPPEDRGLAILQRFHVKAQNEAGLQVALAVEDSYKRLLAPSLENELRNALKERADREAIRVFAANLRELLLAPPLGQKRVMALDPGFRTGSKLVCLNGQGKLLYCTTVYPTLSEQKSREAGKTVVDLCAKYSIEAIAIGNGTAGRETEAFVRGLPLDPGVLVTMVDESGASIYSASEAADPKVIGVGQYQHDVNQAALKKGLEDVVESCVNSVGVEVNTASMELLTHVSGLGPVLAKNIIAHRNEHGPFGGRRQLLKVPRLGAKAFQQCAGFLRIQGARNPLDYSAVHPEQYGIVEQMAEDAGCTVVDLMQQESARKQVDVRRYVSDAVGLPTLSDIMAELAKPGRDPRAEFALFSFAEGVNSVEELQPGMKLPGIVTNVTKFGAFVDVGVHQDGLIHISQLADRFVKDPAEVVRVRQQVMVRVLEIDPARKRIALSLKDV